MTKLKQKTENQEVNPLSNPEILHKIDDFILGSIKRGVHEKECAERVSEDYNVAMDLAKTHCEKRYQDWGDVFDFNNLHPIDQIKGYLTYAHPNLRWNEITHYIEIGNKPQEERALNSIFLNLSMFGFKKSEKLVFQFLNSDKVKAYHPIRDFFESHKSTNPKGKIKELAACIDSKTGFDDDFFPEYTEYFLTKWLVGAVASAYGHANPLFIILAGKQRTGKTEFFRRLLPKPLHGYAIETSLDNWAQSESDEAMKLCQNLLIGDDDMEGKKRKDWAKIKALLSKKIFKVRKPYGKGLVSMPRLASFWGTSNELELIGDPTGNRRIIPIEVEGLDHTKYNAIDKTELWMEAWHLFQNSYQWELDKEDVKKLEQCTLRFQMVDPVSEMIQEFFQVPDKNSRDIQQWTATQICREIKQRTGQWVNEKALGVRMKKMGFEQKTVRIQGKNTTKRVYLIEEITEPVTIDLTKTAENL